MLRCMLKSKIHKAVITESDLHYVGSITIDKDMMDAVGITEFEKVEIFNIQNGHRFATYVIEGKRGSGIIGINGAAARLVHVGDEVIIVSYAWLTPEEMQDHTPKIIVVSDDNTKYNKA